MVVALCGGLLAIPGVIRAAPTETAALNEWAGLVTTSGETDFTSGTGNVVLAASLVDGVTRGWIDLTVSDYAIGSYTVSTVTVSSSATEILGDLTVRGLRGRRSGESIGQASFGFRHKAFPPGFDPFDVATISVSDSNGNVVSSATLTPVPDGSYNALSPFAPGTGAPRATGYALIRADGPEPIPPVVSTGGDGSDAGGDGGASSTTSTGAGSGSLTLGGSQIFELDGGTSTVGGLSDGGASTGTITAGGGSLIFSTGNTDNGGTVVDGGTLTVGGTLTGNPVLGDGGASITINTGTVGTGPVLTSSTGTLTLSGAGAYAGGTIVGSAPLPVGPIISGPPLITGTLSVDGSGPYAINGGTFVTGSDGGIVITGSTPSGGTLILTGSCITSGTFSIISGPIGQVLSAHPLRETRARTAPTAAATPPPVTGRLVLHAQGLPASATLSYFADGAFLNTATTDSKGRLSVTAIQGGLNGTLPSTLDLYSVQAITIQDGSGNILLTAQF
jgi:hypothetical protein